MTIDLIIEKSSLIMQKDQLEYREMILSEQLNTITQQMSDESLAHEGDDDYEADSDPIMEYYEAQQKLYDSQKESIESQLKEINAEVDSYDKAVDTNVKQECKLSISV